SGSPQSALIIHAGHMTSVQEVNPAVRRIRAPTRLQDLAIPITDEILQRLKTEPLCACHHCALSQVLAACMYPKLLEEKSLPLDVRQRAQKLLGACGGGSVGSYSATPTGIPLVHKSIAEFIERRDCGVSSHQDHIILSSGFEKILWMVLHLMSNGEGQTQTGLLTPVPCPQTVPMLLDVSWLTMVPYQLKEDRGWALDLDELRQALETGRRHCEPRAIFISNPGNPTGHVQDRETIEEVINFAATEGLVLLVEEVDQESVFGQDKEFFSYKQVLFEMGQKYSEMVELISFNALSGAKMGECGLRGGYMEVINMDPAVKTYLRNMQATSTPPVLPQLALEVMVNPPSLGDPSYETYTNIVRTQTTLSQNAHRACEFLNELPGMSCQPAMAGTFLYPHLNLPPQMIEKAKTLGVEADVLYCQKLLEEEGVCLGPGCENGQDDQNYHIRLSFLVPPVILEDLLLHLRSFHLRLLEKFP
uniref:alanine transaminase n=1 Tax=Mola mola TaxID=94237 RepID=A0A3Q3WUQ4_MOLML